MESKEDFRGEFSKKFLGTPSIEGQYWTLAQSKYLGLGREMIQFNS